MNAKTIGILAFVLAWYWLTLAGGLIVAGEPKDAGRPLGAAAINPIFDSQSFWYTPIPKNVVLHTDSKNLVAAFKRQKEAGSDDLVGINTESFASPVYIADRDTPTIAVRVDHCPDMGDADFDGLAARFQAVPMPLIAEPACADDSEMTIYQPSTDTLWEFWRAKKNADGGWQACWGGRMDRVSKSCGIWPNPFGATATGLPFVGGQITPEELAAGEIKHAMGIALVEANETFSWPATRSDGIGCCKSGMPCIPEGSRFRVDPCVNVDQLKMHRVGKIVAKAAQKYGFVVWDKAKTTSLRAKNPKSYTRLGLKDPYRELFGSKDRWTVLDGFPWDKLQFLPANYGRPHTVADEWKAKSRQVDELLGRWISKTGPGVAVMVIQDHQIVHQRGYGMARLDPKSQARITATTNFRLASLTKQFTGMAIAMLIEEKKLKLSARLFDYFPDQSAREIRVHHLLHHTSGLREYGPLFRESGMIDEVEFQMAGRSPLGFEPTNADVFSLLKSRTLFNYPPGRVFLYNNSGYVFLAGIIEEVSGMPYRQFLKRRIFDPLGMTNTYVCGNPDRHMPDLAYSYDFYGVGARQDIDYSPLNKVYGDDGVYSNLADLYKWDQALLFARDQVPPAKPLVSDETLCSIFRSGTLNDGSKTGYGFGWFVKENPPYVEHDGDWLGFRTYIRHYLAEHFGIVVLSNFAGIDVQAVTNGIDAIYYPPSESRSTLPRPISHDRAATRRATRNISPDFRK